jgi:hypothetical protein
LPDPRVEAAVIHADSPVTDHAQPDAAATLTVARLAAAATETPVGETV